MPNRTTRGALWWLVAGAAVGGYLLGRRQMQTATLSPDLALRAGTELLRRCQRVLALGATPGELEREIGGTLWRFKQAGAMVAVATAQPPATGGRANQDEVALRELQQAQAVLGYDAIDLLPALSGAGGVAALVERITSLWEQHRPDLVLIPADRGMGAAARRRSTLAQAALVVAEQHGNVQQLAIYGAALPNTLVDISRALQQKWAGLRSYPSALPGPDPAHRWLVDRQSRRGIAGLPSAAVEGVYRL